MKWAKNEYEDLANYLEKKGWVDLRGHGLAYELRTLTSMSWLEATEEIRILYRAWKKILFHTRYEDLPLHVNDPEIRHIVEWRFMRRK